MTRAFASCTLTGDNFSPKELLKRLPNISFDDPNEKGDRHPKTGRIWNYGGVIINHASHLNKPGDKIAWEDMLDFLVQNHQTIRDCGGEYIDLTLIFFYQDEGGASWYIEDKDIRLLSKLGIGLSIDWYHIEDESSY